MTDENLSSVSQPMEATQVNVQPETAQEATEKMIPQSEVNKLVGAAKQRGYEKAVQSQQQSASAPAIDVDQLKQELYSGWEQKQRAEQEARQKELEEQQAQQMYANMIQELQGKLQNVGEKYSDFKEVIAPYSQDFQDNPHVLMYMNSVDNADDVMYELAKKPDKMALLMTAPYSTAQQIVRRISESVKQNEAAKANFQDPGKPLSQVKPSNVGVDSGERPTLKDFKKIYRT